jgi:cytochrome c oxidase assembly protein subunit 17
MAISTNESAAIAAAPARPRSNYENASSLDVDTSDKKPLKPCCACPETKKARDNCMLFASGAETAEAECKEFIEKHRSCMSSYGFKV